MIEFERRWKITSYPKELVINESEIEQYYIIKDGRFHFRLRKRVGYEDTTYTCCSKIYIEDNIREEFEDYLSENSFNRILSIYPNAKKETKKRVYIKIDSLVDDYVTGEIDIFEDGSMVVEVEFLNKPQMENFMLPDWFGEEIVEKKFFIKENNIGRPW